MLKEGSEIGSYTIEALVGKGGTSSVYRARHRVLKTMHALKVLHAGHEQDPLARDRFVKEGQVLARLRHPALVHVTDVLYDQGVAALVMDHLEGHDLSQIIAQGPLEPTAAADILLQVLSGVAHAHRSRVFHRDLKPANLFLVDAEPGHPPYVKILDFGIAKVADSFVTRAAHTLGTIPYMSPEQVEHPGEVDARSDVFSLGSVLFEMVAGYRPFSGETDFETQRNIVQGHRRELPMPDGPLHSVIHRALQRVPADRYPSAEAFADALRPMASDTARARVDGWAGSGTIDADDLDQARDSLTVGPRAWPEADLVLDPAVTRRLGLLQLFSGLFNLTVMSTVHCFGVTALGGLSTCFAGLLVVVGLAEVASGLRAAAFGSPAWLRATAWLEVVSVASLGVVSAFVGLVVLIAGRRRSLPELVER
ncbi:MAG: serine/threonine-protein kinase [Myxococcota bacterium]